jgi:hypothetical protein
MKTSRDCSGIEKDDRIGRPYNYFPAIEIDVDHHFAAPLSRMKSALDLSLL